MKSGSSTPIAFDQDEAAAWFEQARPTSKNLGRLCEYSQQMPADNGVKRSRRKLGRRCIHNLEIN